MSDPNQKYRKNLHGLIEQNLFQFSTSICNQILFTLQKSMNVPWACTYVHQNTNVVTRLEPMTVTATREDGISTSQQHNVKVKQLASCKTKCFHQGVHTYETTSLACAARHSWEHKSVPLLQPKDEPPQGPKHIFFKNGLLRLN